MKKILIVEDDELIADLERDYLEAGDFEVETALDGSSGMEKALSEDFDLLILDVMLPGRSGFDICRAVRKEKNVPIIMVTAKKEDVDKIRGLGLGADDYISKPFSPAELVARVRAHIRIHELLTKDKKSEEACDIKVKDLTIVPSSRRVFIKNKEIIMTKKEFELLFFLASRPNIVFSKDTLFDRVWGMDALGDISTVTVHVNRIREKIENDSSKPEYIETVWGAGYRFTVI